MPKEIYVVTFSARDGEQGEFHTETAFIEQRDAKNSAFDCMKTRFPTETFYDTGADIAHGASPHVVRKWSGLHHTVWLERLEVFR